jgi:hypothetical protein
MRNLTKLTVAATFVLAALPAMAAPVTLDFSSGVYSADCGTYTQSGFTVATQAGDHTDGCAAVVATFAALYPDLYGSAVGDVMLSFHDGAGNSPPNILSVSYGGGAFDLNSIDIPEIDVYFTPGNPSGFLFTASGGGTLTILPNVYGTINFGSDFDNITSFTLQITEGTGAALNLEHALDTFVLNTLPAPVGVPEPMTLSLLGAGLAGMGALRRRRE